jgi:ElaB/YqjD/DUF883 family membrane-anchored ribosome-binding protein
MSTGSPAAAGTPPGAPTDPTTPFGTERAQQQSADHGGQAQERAQQAAGQAQERTQQAAGQAQERAQQAAGQAQERAHQAADQAKNRLREQLDQRSSQAAEKINEQASDFRSVSESLREQGKDGPASAADKLAEYAEKVGGYLRDRDSDALVSDAEDYGRRQPWTVVAGGLALGFAASRFLKASSGRRYSERPSSRDSSVDHTGRAGSPASTPGIAGPPYQPTTTHSGVTDPAPAMPPFGSAETPSPLGAPVPRPGI